MLTSYAFSPKTSIYNKKAAIDSAFIYPLYRGRVSISYRVLYVIPFYTFIAFFYFYFYLISTYLAIYIVDLHLYQQPPILYYYRYTLPAQYRVSTQYYSNSYISYSLSTTYRQRVSQLISFGVMPLQRALAPYIRSTIQRIFFFTRQPYTIEALYIVITALGRVTQLGVCLRLGIYIQTSPYYLTPTPQLNIFVIQHSFTLPQRYLFKPPSRYLFNSLSRYNSSYFYIYV